MQLQLFKDASEKASITVIRRPKAGRPELEIEKAVEDLLMVGVELCRAQSLTLLRIIDDVIDSML